MYESIVLNEVFERLQHQRFIRMRLEAICPDGSRVKVRSDGTRASKKGASIDRKARGGWPPKIHLVAVGPDCPLILRLSPGNAHDGLEGHKLIKIARLSI